MAAYKRYPRPHPDAAAVWLELARTESWRGNYGAALECLEKYGQWLAITRSTREKAAVLARAGRPAEALDTIAPLLLLLPDDYELNLTSALRSATAQRRTREASDALETLRGLQPDAAETRSAERVMRATLSPTADPGVSVYGDSSGLEVKRACAARVGLVPERCHAGGRVRARAPQREPRQRPRAGRWSRERTARSGVGQRRPAVREPHGSGAHRSVTDIRQRSDCVCDRSRPCSGGWAETFLRTELGVLRRVAPDDWPRIASGQSSRRIRGAGISWRIVADVWQQSLSDGNDRWEFTVAPRRGVARTERLNLDLGFTVTQLRTTTNYDNGYYDPSLYQYYAFTAYPYWKAARTPAWACRSPWVCNATTSAPGSAPAATPPPKPPSGSTAGGR